VKSQGIRVEVRVDLGARGYDIRIGDDFSSLFDLQGKGNTALVVADSNTGPLYAQPVMAALAAVGFCCDYTEVPAGESSKSLSEAGVLLETAVQRGLDRKSLLVALGGGVIGDLVGFTAAIYLRGISFLQVPTSLLAMVDSAVGGKTGVNLPQGKNLVGSFYQPVAVAVNLATLQSLPEREYRSGLAEVVKYGVLADEDFFAMLEREKEGLLRREPALLASVVARCCEIKADVVSRDEREGGLRAILNYGHTLGHAIEAVCGYGMWLHGEAVALGMVFASQLSQDIAGLLPEDTDRIRGLLEGLGLPVRLPDDPGWERLRAVMSADKKAERRVPTFVLAEAIGRVRHGCRVSEQMLVAAYQRAFRAVSARGGVPCLQ
jgi:3-dehydroquinate synthase